MDFDNAAASWDDDRRTARAKIIAQEIAKTIKMNKSFNALEFGCGTGLVGFNLYDKVENLILIDNSEGMIDKLNSKIEKYEIKNMKAYKLDINEEHRLTENTYDLIYTSMALHHVADTKKTLEKLHNLLKMNGYLCIVELNKDDGSFHKNEKDFNGHNGFDQQELISLMNEIKFKEITSKTFYYDEKVIDDNNIKYSLFIMVGRK